MKRFRSFFETGRLKKFLHNCQSKIRESNEAINSYIVFGNQAADLDSHVSALVLAYFKQTTTKQSLFVPALNLKRQDFGVRPEIRYLFSAVGLSANDLIFWDDDILQEYLSKSKPKVVLVDHNRLASSQEFLEDSVFSIVDHRADEGFYPSVEGSLRQIAEVGSCCTFVAQDIAAQACALPATLSHIFPCASCKRELSRLETTGFEAGDFLDRLGFSSSVITEGEEDKRLGVALLLLSTIVSDTGFDSTRTMSEDSFCMHWLASMFSSSVPNEPNTIINTPENCCFLGALNLALRQAKSAVSHLSTPQLLAMDYKEAEIRPGEKWGFSALPCSLNATFATHPSIANALADFLSARAINPLIITTSYYSATGFSREIGVVTTDCALVERLDRTLAPSALGLHPLPHAIVAPGLLVGRFYTQTNLAYSRKKLIPLLRSSLS
eukprot:GCRY01001926.1.p1 GENE.GCRY01001926.1~~GCRY01001926.1.p1  ORF type:complete len:460 (-),score=61.81 GCRY01001926.1:328-1644(-)